MEVFYLLADKNGVKSIKRQCIHLLTPDSSVEAQAYAEGLYQRRSFVLYHGFDQVWLVILFKECHELSLGWFICAGEKRKEEEMIELEGQLGKSDAVNRKLVSLERELSTLHKNGTIDPFGLYLYGLMLKAKGSENLARTVLVESVNSYPWNGSAWSELQSLCTTIGILSSLNLINHRMKDFFLARALSRA